MAEYPLAAPGVGHCQQVRYAADQAHRKTNDNQEFRSEATVQPLTCQPRQHHLERYGRDACYPVELSASGGREGDGPFKPSRALATTSLIEARTYN